MVFPLVFASDGEASHSEWSVHVGAIWNGVQVWRPQNEAMAVTAKRGKKRGQNEHPP